MMKELGEKIRGQRMVILGLGNSMHGDDGVGPAIIDHLRGRVEATLIDAEEVPENHLGQIEAARPEVVIIIDAIEMGTEPGDVVVFEISQVDSWGKLTHNPTLGMLARVIHACTGAEVVVVGIQPASAKFGAGLSAPVLQALHTLGEWFQKIENS
jgi:hydrogenase 3 maturation protease